MLLRYFLPALVLVINLQKYTTQTAFSLARHLRQIFKIKMASKRLSNLM